MPKYINFPTHISKDIPFIITKILVEKQYFRFDALP